eukprot:3862256-Rhodomonas_salina.1
MAAVYVPLSAQHAPRRQRGRGLRAGAAAARAHLEGASPLQRPCLRCLSPLASPSISCSRCPLPLACALL